MVTALPVPEAWEVTPAAGRTSKEGTTPGTKQLHVDLCTNPVFVPSLFLQQQCRRLWECIKVFAQGQEVLQQAGDSLASPVPATASEPFTIYNEINSVLNLVKISHCYSESLKSSQSCFPESLRLIAPHILPMP